MSEFPKVVSNHVNIIELRFVNQITIFSIPEWVHNYEWFWIKNRAGEATLSLILENRVESSDFVQFHSFGTLGFESFDVQVTGYNKWCKDSV